MAATIRDVAKEAGVSVATVSRVLNKNGYVSEESERKVLKAIKKLNYRPNSVARALFHKTSKMIGLIVPDITNPFFPELARAVEDVSMIYGYKVLLGNSDGNAEKEQTYIDLFNQKYVDGVIMTGHSSERDITLNSDTPVVVLDRASFSGLPTVTSNNYEGARQATKLLIEKGAENIAHIRGPREITSANDRYRGFIDEIEENNMSCVIEESAFNLAAAEEVAHTFYDKFPHIDGVFCSNDTIAVGFLKVALKRGIQIPEELQIVGFDGVAFGKMVYPELTTVAQPIYDLGAVASRLLIKLIENEEPEQKIYELETKVIERGTTR
ncbi:LacI family DNA-binding transcriptional regulator [Sporosarcina ureilytica]|uniref:Catabolite control protein A n=1 Tax=Sporosarcina ureilytica TaxID=298596 RepID=A0A1D8JHG5_9BACL|nr:LacI family DNA-binding transcriptional regulator [Sporosarcina ureilytica]AOV08167.1 transcriptional regulator [Sporosarcina ureilytica]